MSARRSMVDWAIWWSNYGQWKVWPEELVEIFKGAGIEAGGPSLADARASMALLSGCYVGGRTAKHIRHWCGVFAVYLLKHYVGLPGISWSLTSSGLETKRNAWGGAVYDGKHVTYMGGTGGIRPGDIAVVERAHHHFVVTDIVGNKLETVDGNAGNQHIRWYAGANAKYVLKNGNGATQPYGYFKILR